MGDLAHAEYKALDTDLVRKDMAQRTIIHDFLTISGPFVTLLSHADPTAY